MRYTISIILTSILAVTHPLYSASQEASDPETLKNEGNLLYRDGKLDEAIMKWQEAILADSTYSFAYNNIGVALYDKQDFHGSVEYLEKAVTIDSTYAKAFNSLGNAYLALADYENAKRAYQSALVYEPGNADTHLNLGNTHLAIGRYDLALAEFEEALNIDSNHARAMNNIGLIYWQRGELDNAVEWFRDSLRADSEYINPMINLAMLYNSREDPDGKFHKQALDYLNRAQKLAPENPDVLFNLCLHYLYEENQSKSRQLTAELVQMCPDDPVAHYLQGQSYALSKTYEAALKSFTEAFTLDSNFSRARIAIDETSRVVELYGPRDANQPTP